MTVFGFISGSQISKTLARLMPGYPSAEELKRLADAAAATCGQRPRKGEGSFGKPINERSRRALRAFVDGVCNSGSCPKGHLRELVDAAFWFNKEADQKRAQDALEIWRDKYAETRWEETDAALGTVDLINTLPTDGLREVAGAIAMVAMTCGSDVFKTPNFREHLLQIKNGCGAKLTSERRPVLQF